MNWKYVTLKSKDSEIPTAFQMDTVGNILQQKGGVKPVACQICKEKFQLTNIKNELTQDIPFYNCKNCLFQSSTGDGAFDHTLEKPKHKIMKSKKQRIVGHNTVSKGNSPHIIKIDNDILILCSKCDNNG